MRLNYNFSFTQEDMYLFRVVSSTIEGAIGDYTQTLDPDILDDFFNPKRNKTLEELGIKRKKILPLMEDIIIALEKQNIFFQKEKEFLPETGEIQEILRLSFSKFSTFNEVLADIITHIDWPETLKNIALLGFFQNNNNSKN